MVTMARAAVYLSLCLSVCEVRGSHVTTRMNKTIQSLLSHYNIPLRERFNGTPVFPREAPSGRAEMQRVFFGAVLETYEKLMERMLKQLQADTPPNNSDSASNAVVATVTDDKVREELSFVLRRVRELRKNRFHEQNQLLHDLDQLTLIPLDNLTTQSKALWELPRLYELASQLTNHTKTQRRRRRRRQAWRQNKPRPSA